MNLLNKLFAKVNKAVDTIVDGEPNDMHEAWDDLIRPLFGRKLYSNQGTIDTDWNECALKMQPSGDITDKNDVICVRFQKPHSVKSDTKGRLHLHWKQEYDGVMNPEFTIKYRVEANGGDATTEAWETVTVTSDSSNEVFPRPTASGEIVRQITKLCDIDWTNVLLSSEIIVKFTRSDGNTGNLFATTLDMHVCYDQRGSRQEYVK